MLVLKGSFKFYLQAVMDSAHPPLFVDELAPDELEDDVIIYDTQEMLEGTVVPTIQGTRLCDSWNDFMFLL